ncbi:hypothetical protein Mal64_17260 [Pseudobythopirellula maris]|uniref:Uncharacterized protein n=1 Tax=Pseudobythopirellula maris TaxID=2527991 RepID=A0A5C5ZMN9_9BACT|nr:hypothetical protein [Pseudobythopirellula maris]TWT88247.1 hypothetical protein Mal64_17260 [Pseudobythopirellula maris]
MRFSTRRLFLITAVFAASAALAGALPILTSDGDLLLAVCAPVTVCVLTDQALALLRQRRIAVEGRGALLSEALWRLGLSGLFVLLTADQLARASGVEVFSLSEDTMVYFVLYPYCPVLLLLLLSALVISGGQRAEAATARRSRAVALLGVVGGAACVWALLQDMGLIPMLVHVATDGIESTRAADFRRSGTFPNHLAEGYFTFWTMNAIVVGLLLSAIGVMEWSAAVRRTSRIGVVRPLVFVGAIGLLAAAAGWWVLVEFPRVSPDLAQSPLNGGMVELALAALLAMLCCLWIARATGCAAATPARLPPPRTAACAGVLALVYALMMLYGVGDTIRTLSNPPTNFWGAPISFAEHLGMLLSAPTTYMELALLLAMARLLLALWRNEESPLPATWSKPGAVAFFGALALLAVGGPLLAAFALTVWLGPV